MLLGNFILLTVFKAIMAVVVPLLIFIAGCVVLYIIQSTISRLSHSRMVIQRARAYQMFLVPLLNNGIDAKEAVDIANALELKAFNTQLKQEEKNNASTN